MARWAGETRGLWHRARALAPRDASNPARFDVLPPRCRGDLGARAAPRRSRRYASRRIRAAQPHQRWHLVGIALYCSWRCPPGRQPPGTVSPWSAAYSRARRGGHRVPRWRDDLVDHLVCVGHAVEVGLTGVAAVGVRAKPAGVAVLVSEIAPSGVQHHQRAGVICQWRRRAGSSTSSAALIGKPGRVQKRGGRRSSWGVAGDDAVMLPRRPG